MLFQCTTLFKSLNTNDYQSWVESIQGKHITTHTGVLFQCTTLFKSLNTTINKAEWKVYKGGTLPNTQVCCFNVQPHSSQWTQMQVANTIQKLGMYSVINNWIKKNAGPHQRQLLQDPTGRSKHKDLTGRSKHKEPQAGQNTKIWQEGWNTKNHRQVKDRIFSQSMLLATKGNGHQKTTLYLPTTLSWTEGLTEKLHKRAHKRRLDPKRD